MLIHFISLKLFPKHLALGAQLAADQGGPPFLPGQLQEYVTFPVPPPPRPWPPLTFPLVLAK